MKQSFNLIRNNFSRKVFTEKDFSSLLRSHTHHIHPNHLLHEMSERGYLRRLGAGRYRIA